MKNIGSRAEVWHGKAKFTSGRLTKTDLHKNKLGRIVSKKKSLKHSKDPHKNPLLKGGLQQKKGSKIFGPLKHDYKSNLKSNLKNNSKKSNRRSNKNSKNSNFFKNLKNLFL
tara:strand:- start:84 stop:419 length:336 start_codon:yes stop_codon:yes gene_type:complete